MASVDGSKSLYLTSDEAADNLCDPCKFGGIQTNGTHYCKTCAEYLCRSCKESHNRFKVTRNHTVVPGKDAESDTQNTSQFKVYCTCDQLLEVAVYCENHKDVACMTCKSVKHRKCNVTPLSEKGVTYKVSDIQNIIQNAQSLDDEIKQFVQNRDADVQMIESMIETSREKMKSFRRDLGIFLDKLESDMLSELYEMAVNLRHDAEQHIPTCQTTLQSLDDYHKLLGAAAKCSNPEMVFAADVKISNRLIELRSMMKDFQDEVKIPHIEFEENQKLLDLKREVSSLGTLVISKTGTTNFLKMKVRNLNDVQIKLQNDKEEPWITGCMFMEDGQLLLCDRSNNNIKLLNSKFEITESISLESYPWDISAVDSTIVVVTLPDIKQLQFIDVPSLNAGKHIQLDRRCYGVDVFRDEIYVICHDSPGNAEICAFDKNGTFIRKISDVKNNLFSLERPYYIAVSKTSSKIYISDWETHIVRCISTDGSLKFNYKEDDLRNPRTVLTDEENILVCGQRSCNIHTVTSTGQRHSVLYTVQGRSDIRCFSLAYRPTDHTLVIGLSGDYLLVLQLARTD